MSDILVPIEQEGTKAVVRSWLKNIGDFVAVDDPLVELETDKVTQEVSSPVAGVLTEILLNTDDEAMPGAVLGRLSDAADDRNAETVAENAEQPIKVEQKAIDNERTLSPAVRKAVRQYQIDPATLTGTGRGGRVTREDVERAVAARDAAPTAPAPQVAARDVKESTGATRVVPHDRMRLAIAANMLNSVTVAPHVTAVFECDFSAIIAHRKRFKAAYEGKGANLTFTAYLIAACVEAMRAAPSINSRWYDDRLEIYDDVNVGIGTALGDKGLVVPVVPKAQELSLEGIARRLADLTARARGDRLTPADMRGGTFTISNHGVSGSLIATPIIIAQPQSAILGVGKLEKRVVVREIEGVDTIQIRPLCYVSLTIDHRVVDGHQTNLWLTRFVEAIETWPIDA